VNDLVQEPSRHGTELGMVAAVRRGPSRVAMTAAALALAGAAAGCGDSGTFANQPRPPAPITVTAAIDKSRVRVSPEHFGAGPVTFIVSNQSGGAQDVTFETDEIGGTQAGLRRSAGPVADQGTATLQADPRQGTYRLGVKSRAIKAAAITVGKPRESSQNELLQP
jgi:hypothetical protein